MDEGVPRPTARQSRRRSPHAPRTHHRQRGQRRRTFRRAAAVNAARAVDHSFSQASARVSARRTSSLITCAGCSSDSGQAAAACSAPRVEVHSARRRTPDRAAIDLADGRIEQRRARRGRRQRGRGRRRRSRRQLLDLLAEVRHGVAVGLQRRYELGALLPGGVALGGPRRHERRQTRARQHRAGGDR